MHLEALDFCHRAAKITGPVDRAVEIGARSVNGDARDCWPACHWTGIDLAPGPNVDLVADITEPVDGTWPLVLSTEMLEHCTDPQLAVAHMAAIATEWIVITCATDYRAAHSGIDGGALKGDEHYRNVAPAELDHPQLEVVMREVHEDRGDLYLLARRTDG